MSASGETGIDTVIELLSRLAAGDLDARGVRTGDDEDLDAVIIGINMLAEELTANRDELEQRVRTRTLELEAARQEAMAATRLKSQFLATMSHEIRTPMNGVIGLTRLLLQTQLDDTQRKYADGLRHAGDALLDVIDDILDFSKLEAGMVELELAHFDPRLLVEGVVGLLASTPSRQELELIAYCLPEVPARLVGDEGRLRQILLNLASNAVKFTDKGQVVITADVVDRDEHGVRLRFQVADTGIGIPEEARRTLFDSFTQADASTTRQYGGSGLGLAISRRLTEVMGGVIGVESEEGTGSTFWFEVPLPVSTQEQPGHDSSLLAGLRVLVVDDNPTNRLVLDSQLTEWGMRPHAVARPQDAVALMTEALAAGDPFAIIVLDMCMPEINGLELATLIAEHDSLAGIPSILLSSTTDVDQAALRRAGVDHWLTKPVRSSELLDHLVRLASPPTEAALGPGPSQHPPPIPNLGRVLVVEDNAVNQIVADGLVSSLGYDVDIVENGAEAVEAVEDTAYAAVLMDCHMPVMDGYSATEEIRAREAGGPRLPIIAMTAGATPEDREKCLAAGMDDYMSKPVGLATLRDVLQRWARPADDTFALDPGRLAVLRQLRDPRGDALLPGLAEAFAVGAGALLTRMSRALDRVDGAELREAAHELVGAAGNVGAVRVAALARQIEEGQEQLVSPTVLDQVAAELDRAVRLLRMTPSG